MPDFNHNLRSRKQDDGLTWGEAELRMLKHGVRARRTCWDTWLFSRDGSIHWLLSQAILDQCNDTRGQSRYTPHQTDIVASDWEVDNGR